jgi:ribosome-binding factor A
LEAYSKRQEKVSKLLQKDLADIFLKEAQLFKSALITVTKVRVSPDLSYAKVYLSIFIPGDDSTSIILAIQDQTANIRYALGKRIKNQVKKIPELAFFLDDSLDYIDHIDALLK